MKQRSAVAVIICSACFLLTATGCKKKNDTPEEPQGVTYQRLLKTVLSGPNSPTPEITEYSYDAAGRLSLVTIRNTDPASGIVTVRFEQFHRSAAGRIDSITWRSEANGVVKDRNQTSFIYQPSGQLHYSSYIYTERSGGATVLVRDSSVYTYAGGRISSRTDYRNYNTGTYTYVRTFSYTYDAAGNVTALGAVYANPGNSDTIRLTYDDKMNPLPVVRGVHEIGFWGPAFYDDYHTANNPLSRRNRDWDPVDYEYRYSSNNKPLYQKIKTPGTASYSEMRFYYD